MTSERDDRVRKLEPKIGEKTARVLWLAAQDAKLRKHVDPFISALSDRLNQENYKHEKILLPPPDARTVAGPVKVGEIWYDGPRGQLGLTFNEINRHVGLCGASGSGKSTLGFRIAMSLLKAGKRVIVFDCKRSWRSLAEYVPEGDVRIYTVSRPEVSQFALNVLIPLPGIRPELYDSVFAAISGEVLYSGLGSDSIFSEALLRLRQKYPMPESGQNHFTMLELSYEIQKVASLLRMQKRAGDWASTAIRIARELAKPPLGTVINVRRNVLEDDLQNARLVVFETEMMSQPQFTFFVVAFLTREYLRRMNTEKRDELDLVIIFEEAQNLFSQPYPQPTFSRMLREVRECGLGIVWLAQSAEAVNSTAWANTSTLFVFKQIQPKDINTVAGAIAFERPSREKAYVARLPLGHAICRLPDRFPFAFLIRTDDIRKAVVTDERIHELAMARLKALGLQLEQPAAEPVAGVKKDREPVFQETQEASAPSEPRPLSVPVSSRLASREAQSEPVGQASLVNQPTVSQPTESAKPSSRLERNESAMAHMLAQITSRPGKPVTYMYSDLQLAKSVGDRTKKALLAGGLVIEDRVPGLGGIQKHLSVTEAGTRWLAEHAGLLEKPLVRWQTQRFGGPKSRELEALAIEWAKGEKQATTWQTEVHDQFGGRFDLKFESPSGPFVVELISGESKALEIRHIRRAADSGLPYFGVCWNDTTRERIRRYLEDQGIAENERVVLLTKDEVMSTVRSQASSESATSTAGYS